MHNNKILVIAPSKNTRGGITAVINQYTTTNLWNDWSCRWIETQIDKGAVAKLWYFLRAFIQFLFCIPFYQIVHVHLSEPPSAIRKCFFILPSMLIRKKVILHFHSFSVDTTINGKFRALYSFLFKHADQVIVLSEYWQRETQKYIGDSVKLSVVYNPCPAPINVPDSLEREKTILFAGTLNSRKGFRDLIAAFGAIAGDFPDWRLVLAGNGEIEEGKALVNQMDLNSQVIFTGWIANQEKDRIFKSASIFCLPSYAEGLPMAVLDAMAYGVPVISTPVGGMLDFFEDGEHALIFDPGDIGMLSLHLKALIENPELRVSLSKNAGLIVNGQFNVLSITRKLDDIYRSLLGIQ